MRRKIGVISQWEHLVKRYPEAVQHFNVKLLGTDNGDSHAAAAAAARSANPNPDPNPSPSPNLHEGRERNGRGERRVGRDGAG